MFSFLSGGPPPHAGPKHGGPHGPQVVCDDGSDATCECATKPCGPGGFFFKF